MSLQVPETELVAAEAEIARLQAQVAELQAKHKETEDIATGALHGALESLAAAMAQVDALARALQAMMDGSVYKSIGGDEPYWHSICMPRRAALEKARAALAAAGR